MDEFPLLLVKWVSFEVILTVTQEQLHSLWGSVQNGNSGPRVQMY